MSVAFFDLDKTLLAVNSGHAVGPPRAGAGPHHPPAGAARQPVDRPLPPGLRVHAGRAARGHLPSSRAPSPRRSRSAPPPSTRRRCARALPPGRPARPRGAPRRGRPAGAAHLAPRATSPSSSRGSCGWTRSSATASRWTRGGCTPAGRWATSASARASAPTRSAMRARRACALSACAFYTDSYSDLPVMEVVGRPVAVHPDHRLRREALRRGWPVVDWGVPPGARAPRRAGAARASAGRAPAPG